MTEKFDLAKLFGNPDEKPAMQAPLPPEETLTEVFVIGLPQRISTENIMHTYKMLSTYDHPDQPECAWLSGRSDSGKQHLMLAFAQAVNVGETCESLMEAVDAELAANPVDTSENIYDLRVFSEHKFREISDYIDRQGPSGP